ncbi:MAG TPA: hypothetical protein VD963_00400 [Phycisphaerales bacterium]|nr:hypothetical protein [Phycisphaerales bacterium]
MSRNHPVYRMLLLGLALLAGVLLAPGAALGADKLHLKDGRVLEGRVEKEIDGHVYFVVKVGSIEHTQFFSKDQITKLERDTPAAGAAAAEGTTAPAAGSPSAKPRAGEPKAGRPTRIAILNFGPPSSWQGKVGNTVGIEISAQAWKDAVPLLEKDNVDVVVVRINSGGGLLLELEKFHEAFQDHYKPKFRTVAWVESAISAAAMSPWVIEEFYMMPEGNIGACTGWSGRLQAIAGISLEMVLAMMEDASAKGGHDYRIMRSMQIMEPLSADIDDNGEVTWHQDLSGKYTVNPPEQILTFNASDAVKFKFAKGIAATPDELARAMGYQEYEFAGKRAEEFIDQSMRDGDRTSKKLAEVYFKYQMAVQAAQQEQDRTRRGAEVNRARNYLREIKKYVKVNPNFQLMYPFDDEWFERQEEMLRDLMR